MKIKSVENSRRKEKHFVANLENGSTCVDHCLSHRGYSMEIKPPITIKYINERIYKKKCITDTLFTKLGYFKYMQQCSKNIK